MMVGASSQDTVKRRLQVAKEEGNVHQYIVICGDRPVVHQGAVECGARTLLVTGGYSPDPELAARAKQRGLSFCALRTIRQLQ